MQPARRALPVLLSALVTGILVAGCEPGGGPGPQRTIDPSASPIIDTEDEFCAALDELESEHERLRQIRLRPGNRQALDDRYDELDLAWDDVRRVAPRGMEVQIRAMDWAVIDLGLAIEDYRTTNRPDDAAAHVLRRDIGFDRAIARLRARTDCAPWAPTPRPRVTPSPSAAPSVAPSASAAG